MKQPATIRKQNSCNDSNPFPSQTLIHPYIHAQLWHESKSNYSEFFLQEENKPQHPTL